MFWPFLYGDIFSYAFWPDDYDDPLWAYGTGFLLAGIFAPEPLSLADAGYSPDYGGSALPNIYYGATKSERRTLARADAAAAESCSGLAPGVTGLPIAKIRKHVKPTGDQIAALDDLQQASIKARAVVKASCPTVTPLTPVSRLDAGVARLQAMIRAVDIIRGPLQTFYDSLTDAQKKRLDDMGNAEGKRQRAADRNLAAPCGERSDGALLPVERIEQVVKPNARQQSAFDALKKVSQDAAGRLTASCPTQVPQTPVARLGAAKARLGALVDAMNAVRPKLVAFYDSLGDEQKARFNTMGPAENTAAQP